MFRFHVWLGVCVVAVGCRGPAGGSDPACEPGATQVCACDGGGTGFRACDEGAWSACACGGLDVEPAALDFGALAPGARLEATVALVNRGPAPIPLRSVTLGEGNAFRIVQAPEHVPANRAAALVVVSFAPPPDGGPVVDRLRVEPDLAGVPAVEIPLSGRSWLECERSKLEFGDVPLGTSSTTVLRCTNARSDGVRIEAVEVVADPAAAFAVAEPLPERFVPGRQSFEVGVTHRSEREGEVTGTLAVTIADPPGRLELPLRARDFLGTCRLSASSPAVRLLPGGVARGSLRLEPTGEGACEIRSIATGCDPAEFALEEWPTEAFVLADALELPFRVHTDHTGPLQCRVVLDVANAAEVIPPIDLVALSGWPACLGADGPSQEIVAAAGSCAGHATLRPTNLCGDPIRVTGWRFEGPGSFAVDAGPELPVTLLPGDSLSFPVTYRPSRAGVETGQLVLWGGGDVDRARLPVTGTATTATTAVDTWDTGPLPQLDLLAVVDNGTGMAAEADRVLAALGPLPDVLRGQLDFHLAVTTSSLAPSASCGGPAAGGERGRLVPIDGARPRVITPETPGGRAAWEANLAVGACHDGPSQALEAARLALEPPLVDHEDDPASPEPADGNAGFYRSDAYLGLVLVGDREDASPARDEEYLNALLAKKGFRNTDRVFVWAIAGDPGAGCTGGEGEAAAAGDRWSWLATHTEFGAFASICSADAPPPVVFAQRRRCFFFSNTPSDLDGDGALTEAAGELRVRVNGLPVPATDGAGATAWSTAEATDVSGIPGFCFAPGHEPDWYSAVEAEYAVCRP
jgi:hypothetical protein